MSAVFVDTSAFLALLVRNDRWHPSARNAFERLRADEVPLLTTSYVLVETYALLGRRLGLEAVRIFRGAVAPLVDVAWIDEDHHERSLELLVKKGKGRLSLVDCASFVVMRDRDLDVAFAYDAHFRDEGFTTL
jgi:predicted nucleic acid-binding protein